MIYAFIAMFIRILLLGYERIIFKKAGKDTYPLVSTFWLFFLAAVVQLPLLFIFDWSLRDILNAALSSAIYTITFTIYVYVLSNYEVSLVTPFYNFNVFFLLILSIIFLDESFTIWKVLGIFLLFFGTIFLNRNQSLKESLKAVYSNRGCQLMIITSLLMAVGRIIDRTMINETHPAIYSFAIYFNTSIYLGIILLFKRRGKDLISAFKERKMQYLIGGFTNAYSYLLLLVAFLWIEVSVAEPISMLSVIVSIILSYFIFHETIRDRLIGALIMFAGAILLIINFE